MNPYYHSPREDVLTIDLAVFCVEVFPVRIKRVRKTRTGIRAPGHYLRARGNARLAPRFL